MEVENLILLSGECPGLQVGRSTHSGVDFELTVLPQGGNLLGRLNSLSSDRKHAVKALVTLLTDKLAQEQLSQLKMTLPQLSLIANYAVGYNNIDVASAQRLGIAVTNTPGVLGDATADLTLTLMLMVARRVWSGALQIYQTGQFPGWSPTYGLGIDLSGKTLGIVGLGDIGLRVARRAEVFGMKVIALESMRQQIHQTQISSVERVSEIEFFRRTDVVSLHCPLTPSTQNWLNAERIRALKPGALVINTARGDIVDEQALAEALNSGHLYGAGLDVFCGEPVLSETLRSAKNLLVLPHLGSATVETRAAMGARVLENIRALILGISPLPHQVPIS